MAKQEVGKLFRVGAGSTERVSPKKGRKFKLKELQQIVGGYIEKVPGSEPIAYCNEEGRLHNLPVNALASAFFFQVLVGDVLQVEKVEVA
jgi:hypothetical protein